MSEEVVEDANITGGVLECPRIPHVHPSEETDSEFHERNQIQNGRPSRCRLDESRAAEIEGCGLPTLQPRPRVQCQANTNALAGAGVYCRTAGFVVIALLLSSLPRVRRDWFTGTRKFCRDKR